VTLPIKKSSYKTLIVVVTFYLNETVSHLLWRIWLTTALTAGDNFSELHISRPPDFEGKN